MCAGLIALTSGCSGTGRSCFSNPFKSCFRGDACSTCNAPAGQASNCGTNVAPLCDSCATNTGVAAPPAYSGIADQGVPLYGDPSLNAPEFSNPTIQNGRVTYPESGYQDPSSGYNVIGTESTTGGVSPPPF